MGSLRCSKRSLASIWSDRNLRSTPYGSGSTITPRNTWPIRSLFWRGGALKPACLRAAVAPADAAKIAADLVRLDPERGFRLVETAAVRLVAAMRNPGSDIHGIWSPFESVGMRRPCWEALRALDRDRALRIVLDHAAQAGADGLALTLQLKNLIQMPDDADFLQAYAARGIAEADTVASAIASSDPGFWEVACEIIERYPENESLRGKLGMAAGGFAGGFFGGLAKHAEDAVAQIETILNRLEARFPHARLWLDELLAAYRQRAAEMAQQEADRDIDR